MRRLLLVIAIALSTLGVNTAAANAATLALTPGVDPVEDTSLSIGVDGNALAARRVFVRISSGDTTCAATEGASYGSPVANFPTASGGSAFGHTATFTPSSPGTYWPAASCRTTSRTTT